MAGRDQAVIRRNSPNVFRQCPVSTVSRLRDPLGALRSSVWIAVLLVCLQAEQVFAKPLSFFAKRKFKDRYRAVLSLYAEGETEKALEAMISLESELIASEYSLQDAVRRLEISFARRLAEQSVEALEGLTLFHEALYRQYRDEGNPAAAGHARETMVALAFEYTQMEAKGAEAEGLARLASRQGKEMLASHAETLATSLFEKAVALDSKELDSLLCLAWIHEKRGRYEASFEVLRDLVELDPKHREARLRWAMQSSRQGRDQEAATLLDGLAAGSASDWVRALAVQERARLLADSGELESALVLVLEARKDMPCESGLAVQNAYLKERAESSSQSFVLEETLRRCASTSTLSPRDRYNRLPESCVPSPAPDEDVLRSRHQLKTALAAIR